jgi:phosphoglycolate phosphatase-like HAD superfamily hydrolase
VATWQPHETVVLQTIRDLGLELQVIFNKGAVMILPPGVNKATGLAAALVQLKISPHNVVAVGDAENDHALCHSCGASAAVANALPALKDAVCIRLQNHHGAGVEELIDLVLRDDLASLLPPEPAAIATDATQVLAAATAATDNSYGAASENGAPLLRGTDVPL